MASRKSADNLKKKASEVQAMMTEAQEKYKQSEKELEEFRNTVGTAKAQKESLALLSKVQEIIYKMFALFYFVVLLGYRRLTNVWRGNEIISMLLQMNSS